MNHSITRKTKEKIAYGNFRPKLIIQINSQDSWKQLQLSSFKLSDL